MSRELDIINLVGQFTQNPDVLSDDAFFEADTHRIYTTDMLVEGHHFDLSYFSPEDLGWKAAAVNLSDIAGMGGASKYLLVSLGLPDAIDLQWVKAFYQGFQGVCQIAGGSLIGGDTVGSDRVVVNVTAIGECLVNHAIGRRNQAQAGDFIVTTGYHGLSQVGLSTLQANESGYLAGKAAHLRPQPRIQEGLLLSKQYQHYALMDSSDGLADALLKIAQASGQTLVVDAAKIPVHPEVTAYAAKQNADPMQIVLYGGEDFQLVATLPDVPDNLLAHVHIIGRVEARDDEPDSPPGAWLNRNGQREALQLEKTYQHFGASHP